MRQLLILPIVHAASDLGSLQAPIDRVKIGLIDELAASTSRVTVNAFWENLAVGIDHWRYDFTKLLIYQDALPVVPSKVDCIERKIVKELAEKGSVNHQLVESIVRRGGELIGTEDPNLLLKEYELVKRFLELRLSDDSTNDEEERDIARRQNEILLQRDHFIASRIDETLVAPQVGLIFLGMLHQLENHLPSDIQVSYPFGKPSKEQQDSFSN